MEEDETVPTLRGSVVIVHDERVLLIKHRRHGLAYWVVPGGRPANFEPLDAAVAREIREETGLEVRLGPLLAVFEVNDHWYRHVIDIVFLAETFTGTLSSPSGGPSSETLDRAEFIDRTRLATLSIMPPRLRSLLLGIASGARPAAAYLGDLTVDDRGDRR
jgi:ADP-ribose pyrophosphatase YjhB (NUDIX family)